MPSIKEAGSIALESLRNFFAGDNFQLAAALSYYTLLSIAPLLLVVIGAAGLLLILSATISRLWSRRFGGSFHGLGPSSCSWAPASPRP